MTPGLYHSALRAGNGSWGWGTTARFARGMGVGVGAQLRDVPASTGIAHRIGKKWITLGRRLSFRFARTVGIVTASVLVGGLVDVLQADSPHATEGET